MSDKNFSHHGNKHWMPLYVGDYMADTLHLSTEEHGAYLLLIIHYWMHGPIPDNDCVLAAITKLPLRKWCKKGRESLVPFFTVSDGHWRHKRVDAELARAKTISTTKKSAAKKRWKNGKNGTAQNGQNSIIFSKSEG